MKDKTKFLQDNMEECLHDLEVSKSSSNKGSKALLTTRERAISWTARKSGRLFASGGHEARERRAAEWKSVCGMCG